VLDYATIANNAMLKVKPAAKGKGK